MISTPDTAREKWAHLAVFSTHGEAGYLLTSSPFPRRRNHGSLNCVTLGEVWSSKVNSFSYPLQHIQTCIIFVQHSAGTSLETWTSTKALLSVGDFLSYWSPEAPTPQLRVAGVGLWTTAESITRTESCLPVSQCIVGQDSSWFLDIWCWYTVSLKVLLFVDGCWIFVFEMKTKQRMCFATQCWCHTKKIFWE